MQVEPTKKWIPPTASSRAFWLSLLAILLLAAGLRLYKLGHYPQHFNNDEMTIAYDAWSVWKTGADQHGEFLPTHFRAANEYLPGTAQYIDAPFVGLLGLNEAAARLPFALLGILTVFFTALLGRMWFGQLAGLVAALLLTIDPWHVYFSRMSLVNSIVPIVTVLALYTFTRAMRDFTADPTLSPFRRRSLVWLTLSAFFFAVLLRTYQPMKIEAPLLLAVCLVAAGGFLWRHRTVAVLWIALFLLFASPQIIDQVVHWNTIQLQFRHNNILSQPDWPLTLVRNYTEYYDPSLLFFDGLQGGLLEHGHGVGNLFWLEGLLWLVAIYGLSQRQRLKQMGFSLPALLILWFFIYPMASSLTVSLTPSENRTVNFLPLPELLAGFGVMIIVERLLRVNPRGLRQTALIGFTAGLAALLVFYTVNFADNLFATPILETNQTGQQIPPNLGLQDVLQETARRSTACDVIYIDEVNWIYYLFEMQYPPDRFQKIPKLEENAPPDEFLQIPAFDNVRFSAPNHWGFTEPQPAPPCPKPYREFYVTRNFTQTDPVWRMVYSVNNAAGNPIWRLYQADRTS